MTPSDRLRQIAGILRAAHLHITAAELDMLAVQVRECERFRDEIVAEAQEQAGLDDDVSRAMMAGVQSGRVVRLRGRA